MRAVLIATLAIAAVLAVLFGRQAASMFADSYPQDRLRREALARCEANDSSFLRFSAEQRDACYHRAHMPQPESAAEQN